MRASHSILLALTAILSCGDNVASTTCGPGTDPSDGECVPDGNLICDQGTVYDPVSRGCEIDPSACGPGTVLLDHTCVPDDGTIVVDFEEAAEPNDATEAGHFDVPSIGAAVTIHGCITPAGDIPDLDRWVISTTAPMLLEITADGVGGLASGFVLFDASANPQLSTWTRFGLDLAGDTSKRQVFLPAAGAYALFVDDSRVLIQDLDLISGFGPESLSHHDPVGDPSTCYFATIRSVPLPPTTPITIAKTGQVAGTDSGNVRVFSFVAMAEGDIFSAKFETPAANWQPSGVVLRDGGLRMLPEFDPGFTIGLGTTDEVLLVLDAEHNFALTPRPYTLDIIRVEGIALPTDGTPRGLFVHAGELPGFDALFESNFLYFDITAPGQVVHLDLAAPGVDVAIVRRDIVQSSGFGFDALVDTTAVENLDGKFVRFANVGRYYLASRFRNGVPGLTYTLSAELARMVTPAITVGAPMTAQSLTRQGSTFYTLDIQDANEWIELGVAAPANWGAGNSTRIRLYDLAAGEGLFDDAYRPIQTIVEPPDGSANRGRVVFGDSRDYLVRVDDTGTPDPNPSFTLDIKERPHLTFENLAFDVPATHDDTVPAGGALFVLVKGLAGNKVDVRETPDPADIALDLVDSIEATILRTDTGTTGVPESIRRTFDTRGFLAFAAVNLSASTTAVTSSITALRPPYTVVAGTLAYADICGTGTTVANDLDDALRSIMLPSEFSGFRLFGLPLPGVDVRVSTNGFLSLGSQTTSAAAFNRVLPDGLQPHGTLAPYWDDLFHVKICTQADATAHTFIVQWTGQEFGNATEIAEFQIILHADTSEIDFVYGPDHTLAGDELGGATVGIESLDNTDGITFGFDQPVVAPSTSLHWTPS